MIDRADMEQAGDYVLGLLEGRDLDAFEARMASDTELAQAVERLAARFAALDDTATAEPVAAGLWGRIDGLLDAPRQGAEIIELVPKPERVQTPLRKRDFGWAAIAASLFVAAGLGYLANELTRPPVGEPVVVAVLLNQGDATPGAIIQAFADDSVDVMPLENFEVPEGRVLQVWTLPDAQTGPVSLGTLASAGKAHLAGPNLMIPASGQLYEITLEPAPGSPTGRPTGPILVKGFAKTPVP